jgi:hypothetical protein
MAKSIHFNEIADAQDGATMSLSAGGFWEHWFDTQSSRRPADQNLDEHRVWENAVNFGILTFDKSKN